MIKSKYSHPSVWKGKKLSKQHRRKMSIAKLGCLKFSNRNDKHHNWKGSTASIKAIHIWIKRRKIKSQFCERCFKVKRLDLSNNGHTYKRILSDYEWLCRSCHLFKDRNKNIKITND